MAGIILRGRGFKVVHMVHVAPMGGQGEGPKGQNFANFKLPSPDPVKVEQ